MLKVETLIFDDEKMQHYMTKVGKRICKEREKRGLSVSALAERSNLSASYICKVESAQVGVGLKALIKIAVALELSVSDLLEDGMEQQIDLCATVADRFKIIVCGTDQEIVDAMLSLADKLIKERDNIAEGDTNGYAGKQENDIC